MLVQLHKTLVIPERREDLEQESQYDKHERWLRVLIANGFTPIYVGDTIRVSDRWAGSSKNHHEGMVGEVTGMEPGLEGIFNADYYIYDVRTPQGGSFQTYQYTLDRIGQPRGNQLLEKLLRETNGGFASLYKPGNPTK